MEFVGCVVALSRDSDDPLTGPGHPHVYDGQYVALNMDQRPVQPPQTSNNNRDAQVRVSHLLHRALHTEEHVHTRTMHRSDEQLATTPAQTSTPHYSITV